MMPAAAYEDSNTNIAGSSSCGRGQPSAPAELASASVGDLTSRGADVDLQSNRVQLNTSTFGATQRSSAAQRSVSLKMPSQSANADVAVVTAGTVPNGDNISSSSKMTKLDESHKSTMDRIQSSSPRPASKGTSATSASITSSLTQHLSKLRLNNKQQENKKNTALKSPASGTPTLRPEDVTLPQKFLVKSLGKAEAKGLWGIKHTRKPVDEMVTAARAMKLGATLPYLQLDVSERGVEVSAAPDNDNPRFETGPYAIDCISYGVQDLVFTRVFAMIVVRGGADGDWAKELTDAKKTNDNSSVNNNNKNNYSNKQFPFECHAFVCDSRQNARRLTFALARAFQEFSKTVKHRSESPQKQNFAIDLRTPEQMEDDLKNELDSEA